MWKFLTSATNESNWPNEHHKEVCFIGRSNVGKSSLINALAKTKIARTSNTPGRTQLLNFFFSPPQNYYVDLPGYGYARMPKKVKKEMSAMIENYLVNREQLVKVFVLIDSKVGPTEDDELILNFLKSINKPVMVVMTKSDKANQSELHKSTKKVAQLFSDYIQVSALKKTNIAKLNTIINSNLEGA